MPKVSSTNGKINSTKKAKVLKFLEKRGFAQIKNNGGSHSKFNSIPPLTRPLILTLHDPMPAEYIKNILKQIGCTIEEFLEEV